MAKTKAAGFVSKDELLQRRPITRESRERIENIKGDVLLEHGLSELRELSGVTQTTIAERMATSRPNIYRIEREDDIRLSTLRRYVGALGGTLRIEAMLPNGETVSLLAEQPTVTTIEVVKKKQKPASRYKREAAKRSKATKRGPAA